MHSSRHLSVRNNSRIPGEGRDNQRFVRDDSGNTYYTDDHYKTARQIIKDIIS